MSTMHAASRLTSAANRFGIFVPPPAGLCVTLSEGTREALRDVLGDSEGAATLDSVDLSTVQVESLTRALNNRADTVFRKESP